MENGGEKIIKINIEEEMKSSYINVGDCFAGFTRCT